MSDLEDKLRNLLSVIPQPARDGTIKRIKQAFEYEGYVKMLGNPDFIDNHGRVLMTGQEWFERFEKKLGNDVYGDSYDGKHQCDSVPYPCTCDLLEAARRAAGLN